MQRPGGGDRKLSGGDYYNYPPGLAFVVGDADA
jgi:hypothetical protein